LFVLFLVPAYATTLFECQKLFIDLVNIAPFPSLGKATTSLHLLQYFLPTKQWLAYYNLGIYFLTYVTTNHGEWRGNVSKDIMDKALWERERRLKVHNNFFRQIN
jgi:hypothetical protein